MNDLQVWLRQRRTVRMANTAKEHIAADRACGREWSCACAACFYLRGTPAGKKLSASRGK